MHRNFLIAINNQEDDFALFISPFQSPPLLLLVSLKEKGQSCAEEKRFRIQLTLHGVLKQYENNYQAGADEGQAQPN